MAAGELWRFSSPAREINPLLATDNTVSSKSDTLTFHRNRMAAIDGDLYLHTTAAVGKTLTFSELSHLLRIVHLVFVCLLLSIYRHSRQN